MKPMLAVKSTDKMIQDLLDQVGYVIGSPKMDGVRGIVSDGKLLSRSLKPIRNAYTQQLFAIPEMEGVDGELIVGDVTATDVYRTTNSGVMRSTGEPKVTFFAFDIQMKGTYEERYANLDGRHLPQNVVVCLCEQLHTLEEVAEYEKECLERGFEGIILRNPLAEYKYGRAGKTNKELLKVKRFEDSEAEIIDEFELMHNANEAQTNELGRTFRSTSKEGLEGTGTLGGFHVRDIYSGVEFKIGTGFNAEQRDAYWGGAEWWTGRIVKYKFFSVGVKEKPRHPVFLGFRDKEDMS